MAEASQAPEPLSRFTGYTGKGRLPDTCHVCRKEGRDGVAVERTKDNYPTALCSYHGALARELRAELAREAQVGALTAAKVREVKARVVNARKAGASRSFHEPGEP